MMIYLLSQNRHFKPQTEYTFKVIFSVFGVEWELTECDKLGILRSKPGDILISYGTEKPSGHFFKNNIHIYESELFGKDYLKLKSLPRSPLKRFGDIPIIYRGKENLPEHVISNINSDCRTIETDIDIIASSFFMLSRYEEVLLDKRDEHDRFPAKESLAYREGFLNRPIVNEYIELLWSWIQALNPELRGKPLWPENKQFAVCLTHDVDRLRKYCLPPIITIGELLLRQRKPISALRLTWDYIKVFLNVKKDPFDTFDYMLNLEQKYGFKSSFYFMTTRDSELDGNYSVASPKVVELVKNIESKGCEVGLHATYNTYNDLEKLTREKEELDKIVSEKSYGCRQHYLRCKVPDTWRIQDRVGLLYDTTLTFADHVGFRCGFCIPFRCFDVLENRELDIWELPLIVMEGSLQNPNYQNLSAKEALEQIIKQIAAVRKCNGVFVMLWHNSSFDPLSGWAGWREVYEGVLEYINGQNVWAGSEREIIKEWRRRLFQAQV